VVEARVLIAGKGEYKVQAETQSLIHKGYRALSSFTLKELLVHITTFEPTHVFVSIGFGFDKISSVINMVEAKGITCYVFPEDSSRGTMNELKHIPQDKRLQFNITAPGVQRLVDTWVKEQNKKAKAHEQSDSYTEESADKPKQEKNFFDKLAENRQRRNEENKLNQAKEQSSADQHDGNAPPEAQKLEARKPRKKKAWYERLLSNLTGSTNEEEESHSDDITRPHKTSEHEQVDYGDVLVKKEKIAEGYGEVEKKFEIKDTDPGTVRTEENSPKESTNHQTQNLDKNHNPASVTTNEDDSAVTLGNVKAKSSTKKTSSKKSKSLSSIDDNLGSVDEVLESERKLTSSARLKKNLKEDLGNFKNEDDENSHGALSKKEVRERTEKLKEFEQQKAKDKRKAIAEERLKKNNEQKSEQLLKKNKNQDPNGLFSSDEPAAFDNEEGATSDSASDPHSKASASIDTQSEQLEKLEQHDSGPEVLEKSQKGIQENKKSFGKIREEEGDTSINTGSVVQKIDSEKTGDTQLKETTEELEFSIDGQASEASEETDKDPHNTSNSDSSAEDASHSTVDMDQEFEARVGSVSITEEDKNFGSTTAQSDESKKIGGTSIEGKEEHILTSTLSSEDEQIHLKSKEPSQESQSNYFDGDSIGIVTINNDQFKGYALFAIDKQRAEMETIKRLLAPELGYYLKLEEKDFFELNIEKLEIKTHFDDIKHFLKSRDGSYILFLDGNDSPPLIEASAQADMISIELDRITSDLPLTFDLFVRLDLNQKYVRYISTGNSMSELQKQRLIDKNVLNVHIKKSDQQEYKEYCMHAYLRNRIKTAA